MICDTCRERCLFVLDRWLKNKPKAYGARVAHAKGEEPGYYDGLIDGMIQARKSLSSTGGLDWGALQRELDEKRD